MYMDDLKEYFDQWICGYYVEEGRRVPVYPMNDRLTEYVQGLFAWSSGPEGEKSFWIGSFVGAGIEAQSPHILGESAF